MDCHKRIMHGWINSTLAATREKYWIPQGRQVVTQVLKRCSKCARDKAKPLGAPETGQLPKERVEPSRSFSSIGVDFLEEFKLRIKEKLTPFYFLAGLLQLYTWN